MPDNDNDQTPKFTEEQLHRVGLMSRMFGVFAAADHAFDSVVAEDLLAAIDLNQGNPEFLRLAEAATDYRAAWGAMLEQIAGKPEVEGRPN